MGRHVGWIATHAGIAGGAAEILVPEVPFDLDEVCRRLVTAPRARPVLLDRGDLRGGAAGRGPRAGRGPGGHLHHRRRRLRPRPAGGHRGAGWPRRSSGGPATSPGSPPSATSSGAAPRPPSTGCWPAASGWRRWRAVHDGDFGKMVALQAGQIVRVPLEVAVGNPKTLDLSLLERGGRARSSADRRRRPRRAQADRDGGPELVGASSGLTMLMATPVPISNPAWVVALGQHVDVPVEGLVHPVGGGVEDEVVGHVADAGRCSWPQAGLQGPAHRHEVLGRAAVELGAVRSGGSPASRRGWRSRTGRPPPPARRSRSPGGPRPPRRSTVVHSRQLPAKRTKRACSSASSRGTNDMPMQLAVGVLERGTGLAARVHDGLAVAQVRALGVLLDPVAQRRHHQAGLLVGEHRPTRRRGRGRG